MKGYAGGEIVFTHKLKTLPFVQIPSVLTTLENKTNFPSSKNITSAIHKLIAIQRPKSIEQILQGAAQYGSEGNFANKIMILYALGLAIIPLRGTERPKEVNVSSHSTSYNLTINSDVKPNECATFQYKIISSIVKSKLWCLIDCWVTLEAMLLRYGVNLLVRSKKVAELRYNNPIFEGGVQLPSALRLTEEGEMTLSYAYENLIEGIQLGQYLQLAQLIKNQDIRYQFWSLMEKITLALENKIRNISKQGLFYGVLTFDNIYVVESGNLTLQVDIPTIFTANWRESELPEVIRKIINTPNQTENTFLNADMWNASVILLEIIAFRYGIKWFRRELQESQASGKAAEFLNKFVEYLKEERYVMEGPLLRSIKVWLQLNQEDNFIYFQNFDDVQESVNNFSLVQQSEVVSNDKDFSEVKNVPIQQDSILKNGGFKAQINQRSAQIRANKIEGINLNYSQILWHLQVLKKQEQNKSIQYVAKMLTLEEMDKLYNKILQDYVFFQVMNFDLRPITTSKGRCPKCLNQSTIYVNSCGHGKCENCFLPLIQIANTDKSSERPFKVKCDYALCNLDLCYSLIKTLLKKNPAQKSAYCKLLLDKYATTRQNLYAYCHQKKCSSPPIIYHNNNSRVLLCEICKKAACIECHRNCHKPLTCEQFKSLKTEIPKQVVLKFKDIKWPLDESSTSEDEKKLVEAGLEGTRLKDSYVMVCEWLILLACQARYPKNSSNLDMQSDFLETLSEKVANLLREIHQYCKDGAQATVQCATRCIQLQEIHSLRADILCFAYST